MRPWTGSTQRGNGTAALLAAAALLIGCTSASEEEVKSPSTEHVLTDVYQHPEGAFDGEFQILVVRARCVSSWEFEIYTRGWAGSSTLQISGPVSEEHSVGTTPFDYDIDGWWEARRIILPISDDPEEEDATLLSCEQSGQATWTLQMSEREGEISDCVSWGDDPTDTCREIEPG
ncbi:MAG: hypothetical protein QGG40_16110 [Myxococcota bacterium]|jgi:hypothetical protein|nr:hypothetical protein [Myxococcota bacterium]